MPSRIDANQNVPTPDQYAAAAPVRKLSTFSPEDVFESYRGSRQKACKYVGGAAGIAIAGTTAVVGAVSLPIAIIGGALAVLLGVVCGSAIGERLDKSAAKQATVATVENLVDQIVTNEQVTPTKIFDALDSLDKISDFFRADENDLQKVQDARARLTKKLAEQIDASQAKGHITKEDADILKSWVMDINAIDAKEQGGFGKNLGLLRLDLRCGTPMRRFVDDLLVRFRARYTPDGLMTPLRRTERLKKAIRGDITETASIAESLVKHVKDAGILQGFQVLAPFAMLHPLIASNPIFASVTVGTNNLLAMQANMASGSKPDGALKRYEAAHRLLKMESVTELPHLPQPVQQRVDTLDRVLIPNALEKGNLPAADALLRRREYFLMGSRLVPIPLGDTDDALRALHRDTNALINWYPEAVRPALQSLRNAILVNSLQAQPSRRAQRYLVGEAGVGKTYFVHALASILGLPLIEIDAADEEQITKLSGTGAPGVFSMIEQHSVDDRQLVGTLANALLQSGCANPIIFIDEAGLLMSGRAAQTAGSYAMQQAVQHLKAVLDPDCKSLALPGLGSDIELDFSHATIILAGNDRIVDNALRSRIPEIVFPGVAAQQKARLLAEVFTAALIASKAPKMWLRTQFALFEARIIELDRNVAGVRQMTLAVKTAVDALEQAYRLNQEPDTGNIMQQIGACYHD